LVFTLYNYPFFTTCYHRWKKESKNGLFPFKIPLWAGSSINKKHIKTGKSLQLCYLFSNFSQFWSNNNFKIIVLLYHTKHYTNHSEFMLKRFLLVTITACSLSVFGQTKPMLPYAIQKGSLSEQFLNLSNLSKSQNADFKIIRKTNLEIVRRNVLDSISVYQKEIGELKANSSSSVTTVKNLKDSVTTLDTQLKAEQQKTDSIAFVGIDFAKGTYHTMVWAIIIVLGIAFLATLASFRKAKVDTNEHKKTTEELQNELQTLRKKSMEKEQLLKRQLLDEQMKRNS